MTTLPRLLQNGLLKEYSEPSKRIHDGPDVQFFLQSAAYRDLTTFILQLNRSLVPRKRSADGTIKEFRLDQLRQEDLAPEVRSVQQVIAKFEAFINDVPLDTGPRRFGNVSFRKWYRLVEDQAGRLLKDALPESLHPAIVEVQAYLLGSFGSAQRLDYGSGHELSFLAFLACLWNLGYFNPEAKKTESQSTGSEADTTLQQPSSAEQIEHQIILATFQPYLSLIRNLIRTYNLEPAGSYGVWGLDDNSFLPYIFGSAQLCPPIPELDTDPPTPMPISGSLSSSPDPSIVTKRNLVEKEATHNLYFGAILFIHDIKRGPFWEHSPMLFDISGIKDGWGKINKGLIKMYDAEVLNKFPVVQHFPFGNLLRWEKDPNAKTVQQTAHQTSQPLRDPMAGGGSTNATAVRPLTGTGIGTAAPWANSAGFRAAIPPTGFVNGVTQAPWAKNGAGAAGGRTAVSSSRMPPPSVQSSQPRPLHSQASQPSNSPVYGRQSLQPSDGRPVSAATPGEIRLANRTAETIPEDVSDEMK